MGLLDTSKNYKIVLETGDMPRVEWILVTNLYNRPFLKDNYSILWRFFRTKDTNVYVNENNMLVKKIKIVLSCVNDFLVT